MVAEYPLDRLGDGLPVAGKTLPSSTVVRSKEQMVQPFRMRSIDVPTLSHDKQHEIFLSHTFSDIEDAPDPVFHFHLLLSDSDQSPDVLIGQLDPDEFLNTHSEFDEVNAVSGMKNPRVDNLGVRANVLRLQAPVSRPAIASKFTAKSERRFTLFRIHSKAACFDKTLIGLCHHFEKYMPFGALHFSGAFSGWYMSMKI